MCRRKIKPGPENRARRSDAEITEMLRHIGSELYMCVACAVEYRDARARACDDGALFNDGLAVASDAMLEASLLHARSLVDFLVRDPARTPAKDDTLRSDFIDGDWLSGATPSLKRAAERCGSSHWPLINKHLAHLSWERISDKRRKDPDLTAIARDVLALADAWSMLVLEELGDPATLALRTSVLASKNRLAAVRGVIWSQ